MPLSRGFTCECGEKHEFTSYVFAHWSSKLDHTCEKCQAKHTVCRGVVRPADPKKKSK